MEVRTMQEMIINDCREAEDYTDYSGPDPINAIAVIVAGGFYSDLLKLTTENSDSAELKRVLRSQISMLKGLYNRM